MIKSEFIKIFKSVKAKIIFLILMLIALADTYLAIFVESKPEYIHENYGQHNPAYFSLIAGCHGYTLLTVFLYLMPIFLMLIYCDRYVNERKTGVTLLYSTKTSRKKYFFSKITTAFLFPFLFCGTPNLINIIINSIFLHNGTNLGGMQRWGENEISAYFYFCIHHPYTTYFIFLFMNLLVFGLLAVMCQSLCFIFKDNRIVYVLSLTIWIGIYFSNRIFGLGYTLQPFVCLELAPVIYSFFAFLPAAFISMIIAYFCVVKKKDEI